MYSYLFYHFLEFFQTFLWILNNFHSTNICEKIFINISVSIYKIEVLIYSYNRSTDIFVKTDISIHDCSYQLPIPKNLFVIKSKGGKWVAVSLAPFLAEPNFPCLDVHRIWSWVRGPPSQKFKFKFKLNLINIM